MKNPLKGFLVEDMVDGAIYGLFTVFTIGWAFFVPAALSAYFWGRGGQKGHSWRVFGCTACVYGPFLCVVPPSVADYILLALMATLAGLVLAMGYGLPTYDAKDTLIDKGSALGTMFYHFFRGNEFWANLLTRGTIYWTLMLIYAGTWLILCH